MRAKLIEVTYHCPNRMKATSRDTQKSAYNIVKSNNNVYIGTGPKGNTRLFVKCPCGEDHPLRLRWETMEED